jgi:hypothetical protein
MSDCRELLACLSEEQAALEHLLFKLKAQNLILSSGEHRYLPECTAEVESAVLVLTVSGRRRESVAATVHAAHGLPADAKLTALADAVDDEVICQQLLLRHRSLRDILDQVRRCSRQNREMLAHGLAATTDALALLGAVPTYDASGGVDSNAERALRSFDARV